jgi:hypothetical protein
VSCAEWQCSQLAAPVAINFVASRKSRCAHGRSVSLNVTVPPPSTKQTSSNGHVVGKRLLERNFAKYCGKFRLK